MPVRPIAAFRPDLLTRVRAIIALLTIASLVAGASPGPASAQNDDLPGVDDDSYESPTYGFTLDWNDRDWEVVDAASDEDDGDTLILTNEVSTLYVAGVGAYDGDAQECSIDMGEVVADPDAFDTYPSESGDRDLDPEDYSYLVDCRELVEGEAVLIIVHVFPVDDLGKELVEAQVVTDTIEIAGNVGGSQGSSEDALVAAGVDGNSYESPEWGYTLEWDDDVWEVRDASAGINSNFLNLVNDDSFIVISGIADLGDLDSCMEQAVDFYSSEDGVDNWEDLEDEDGDPIERSTRRRAYAAYSYTITNDSGEEVEFVNYIECRPLDDDAGILISHITVSDDYEVQAGLRDDLLDTLEIP